MILCRERIIVRTVVAAAVRDDVVVRRECLYLRLLVLDFGANPSGSGMHSRRLDTYATVVWRDGLSHWLASLNGLFSAESLMHDFAPQRMKTGWRCDMLARS